MIEVKVICCTTHDALAPVALPYLKLHVCRDNAATDWMNWNGNIEVLLALDCGKLELEDRAMCIGLAP